MSPNEIHFGIGVRTYYGVIGAAVLDSVKVIYLGSHQSFRYYVKIMEPTNTSSASGKQMVTSRDAVEVSVVMPCLNESDTLRVCIEKAQKALRDAGIVGEIIVADNGSTDDSPLIASSMGARVVHVES